MSMTMMEAQAAMKRGSAVRRGMWVGHPDYPAFLVLAPERELTVDRLPLMNHLPRNTLMTVENHIDAIYIQPDGKVRCYLGADHLLANDPFAKDWEIYER